MDQSLSQYFSWREVLYLPKWGRLATESDGLADEIKENLKCFFKKLDVVREFFGAPIVIHCAFRPKGYNALVGGAQGSAHLLGLAADFHVQGIECGEAIAKILAQDKLSEWNLRMENNGDNPTWIHLDSLEPGVFGRYFQLAKRKRQEL